MILVALFDISNITYYKTKLNYDMNIIYFRLTIEINSFIPTLTKEK